MSVGVYNLLTLLSLKKKEWDQLSVSSFGLLSVEGIHHQCNKLYWFWKYDPKGFKKARAKAIQVTYKTAIELLNRIAYSCDKIETLFEKELLPNKYHRYQLIDDTFSKHLKTREHPVYKSLQENMVNPSKGGDLWKKIKKEIKSVTKIRKDQDFLETLKDYFGVFEEKRTYSSFQLVSQVEQEILDETNKLFFENIFKVDHQERNVTFKKAHCDYIDWGMILHHSEISRWQLWADQLFDQKKKKELFLSDLKIGIKKNTRIRLHLAEYDLEKIVGEPFPWDSFIRLNPSRGKKEFWKMWRSKKEFFIDEKTKESLKSYFQNLVKKMETRSKDLIHEFPKLLSVFEVKGNDKPWVHTGPFWNNLYYFTRWFLGPKEYQKIEQIFNGYDPLLIKIDDGKICGESETGYIKLNELSLITGLKVYSYYKSKEEIKSHALWVREKNGTRGYFRNYVAELFGFASLKILKTFYSSGTFLFKPPKGTLKGYLWKSGDFKKAIEQLEKIFSNFRQARATPKNLTIDTVFINDDLQVCMLDFDLEHGDHRFNFYTLEKFLWELSEVYKAQVEPKYSREHSFNLLMKRFGLKKEILYQEQVKFVKEIVLKGKDYKKHLKGMERRGVFMREESFSIFCELAKSVLKAKKELQGNKKKVNEFLLERYQKRSGGSLFRGVKDLKKEFLLEKIDLKIKLSQKKIQKEESKQSTSWFNFFN